ncbi:MAG: ABC transporter permease [Propionibacteriaceae bacterium]|jgi:peptide/nickel transport system permease protein|nr:ABC transporter permease [Propionibacteriaceae bacterium]
MTAVAVAPRSGWASSVLRLRAGDSLVSSWAAVGLFFLLTVFALAARAIAPFDAVQPTGGPRLGIMVQGHILGTDQVGRDLLSRILLGLQTSWLTALLIVAIGLFIGMVIGTTAGTFGGWVDTLLMRVTDMFLSLPSTLVAVAVAASLGPSLVNTVIAISIVWWPYYARIIRGEIRSWAARPHVEAARMAGVSWPRIMVKHLIPGVIPTAIVTASLDVGAVVLTLASLSFLGLGQPAPAPELGADTAKSLVELLSSWWIPVLPGVAVMILSLTANLAGDGIRKIFQAKG